MKKLIVFLIAISAIYTVHAEPELKGTSKELSQFLNGVSAEVSIKVLSKKSVKSDEAVINFVVTSSEDTLKEAIEDNSEILNKVTMELIENGIGRGEISSKAFSSLPGYSFYSKKPTSFTTKKTVSVKVSSEDELIKVLSILDSFEEQTRFLKLTFNFNKQDEIVNHLLTENLKKAAEKKSIYEKSLGIKLRVKRFSEGLTRNNFPQHVAATALKGYLTSSLKTTKSDGIQWQTADQNQQGFSEYVVERELEVIYLVED